ncbi:hypothetical protein BDF14DRAFT_1884147 [Spinellus fusiger]|nr:hypothetical protein BDF14DRAFT_1884147 [Spinellus fusiger]
MFESPNIINIRTRTPEMFKKHNSTETHSVIQYKVLNMNSTLDEASHIPKASASTLRGMGLEESGAFVAGRSIFLSAMESRKLLRMVTEGEQERELGKDSEKKAPRRLDTLKVVLKCVSQQKDQTENLAGHKKRK